MSASEVTDFERSFRYFAIWLHGQVFSKLLLGLFFQCQKSDWTYFKKLRHWVLIRIRTKRSLRHAWTGVCVCVCVCVQPHACTCVSVDLSKAEQSLPTQLHPWPHLVSTVSCWLSIFLILTEAPKYSVTALVNRDMLYWPWLWRALWNCWVALEGHFGQASEMTEDLV